jgi:hypothetical protein
MHISRGRYGHDAKGMRAFCRECSFTKVRRFCLFDHFLQMTLALSVLTVVVTAYTFEDRVTWSRRRDPGHSRVSRSSEPTRDKTPKKAAF